MPYRPVHRPQAWNDPVFQLSPTSFLMGGGLPWWSGGSAQGGGQPPIETGSGREPLGRPDYGSGFGGSGIRDSTAGTMNSSNTYDVSSGFRDDMGSWGTSLGAFQERHPVWSRVIGGAAGMVIPGGSQLWSRGDDAMRLIGTDQPGQPGSGDGSLLMEDPTYGTGESLRRPAYARVPSSVNQGGWNNTFSQEAGDFWDQYQPGLGFSPAASGLFGGMFRTSNGRWGLGGGGSERGIYGGSAGPSWSHSGQYAF